MALVSHEKGARAFAEVWAHVPDLLLTLDTHVKSVPLTTPLKGVVLFADISGFTSLCESYANKSKQTKDFPTDQLTKHLNTYLGRIVQGILLGGGDVLKFAGDAILAAWLSTEATLDDAVATAVTTSMIIQENCNGYQTETGVGLRLKIGLSAGEINAILVGFDEARQFAVTGPAIDDVNEAQSMATSGDVVASPLIWAMCHSLPYSGERLSKGFHKILGRLPASTSSSSATVNSDAYFGRRPGSRSGSRRLTLGQEVRMLPNKALWLTASQKIPYMTFVPRAVMRKLEEGQALEWQSEMRIVTILFINIVESVVSADDVQMFYKTIYTTINHLNGSLNKLFMFDKGCTFLAIFGMPGEKNENDPARALRAARHIFIHLQEQGISSGIGVTTGKTFCGVVGHPRRHEFTVIGSSVNLAARLMMAFSGNVVCDEKTMKTSGLNTKLFREAEPKTPLKGISDAGKLYFYSTDIHHDHFYGTLTTTKDYSNRHMLDGLIGREAEMTTFVEELGALHQQSEDEWRDPTCIVVEGVPGIGKTRLLDAFKAKTFQKGFRVVCGNGGQVESLTPFYAVKTLVARLLGLSNCHTAHQREVCILSKVSDQLKADLPILNELLGIHFVHSERTQHLTSEEHGKLLHALLFRIVHEAVLRQPSVIFVDDAQWIDSDSWSFLYDLASDPNGLLVLSMRHSLPSNLTSESQLLLDHPHTKILRLAPLTHAESASMVRKYLHVALLPPELEQIIVRCNGVPLFVEELIIDMIAANQLEIISRVDYDEAIKNGTVTHKQTTLFPRRGSLSKDDDDDDKVCVLSPGVDLTTISVPHSVKDMVVSRIDRQSHGTQIVLKCASSLGVVFTRVMLAAILPHGEERYLESGVERLINVGMLECAVAAAAMSARSRSSFESDGDDGDDEDMFCPCLAPENVGAEGLHASCSTLRFTQTYIQESAYELLLTDQKRYLHRKAVECLERQAHKCRYCGGGDFVEGSSVHHHAMKVQKILLRHNDEILEQQRPTADQRRVRGFVGQVGAKRVHRRRGGRFSVRASIVVPLSPIPDDDDDGDNDPASSRSSVSLPLAEAAATTAPRGSRLQRVTTSFDLSLIAPSDGGDETSADPHTTEEVRRHFAAMTKARKLFEGEKKGVEQSLVAPTGSDLIIDGDWSVDMNQCECAEVLSHVYPELVRHCKESGLRQKHFLYLIEAGAAAVKTSANLNAVSYLEQARSMANGKNNQQQLDVSTEEAARIESLLGQALFQMGHTEECMPHFNKALEVLGKVQPSDKKLSMLWRTTKEGFRQFLHLYFPVRFKGKADLATSKKLLERARCLAHVSHVHHVHHNNLATVMAVLQQLNQAEIAQRDLHQLLDAYAVMIECCQHFGWRRLGRKYAKIATKLCDNARFTPEDLIAVAHLLIVKLNMHLSFGEAHKAIRAGGTALAIAGKLHDLKIPLSVLPLLFHARLLAEAYDGCKGDLALLKKIWTEEEDKTAEAWYYACAAAYYFKTREIVVPFEKYVGFVKQFCTDVLAVTYAPEAAHYLTCMTAFRSASSEQWSDCCYWLDLCESLSQYGETYVSGKANIYELRALIHKNRETKNKNCLKEKTKKKKLKMLTKTLPVLKSEFASSKKDPLSLNR